jgi:hypothetical protein
MLATKFAWGRGYGAFSVSHSGVGEVAKYIAAQEQHHRKRSFAEELKLLVQRYGLTWHDDKTVERNGFVHAAASYTQLKLGVNERGRLQGNLTQRAQREAEARGGGIRNARKEFRHELRELKRGGRGVGAVPSV